MIWPLAFYQKANGFSGCCRIVNEGHVSGFHVGGMSNGCTVWKGFQLWLGELLESQ